MSIKNFLTDNNVITGTFVQNIHKFPPNASQISFRWNQVVPLQVFNHHFNHIIDDPLV